MKTLINVVLDKSGSMGIVWDATISGFNEFLLTQQKEAPDALLSLTLFDTTYKQPHKATPVTHVAPLTKETYNPGGNTALYDAIGNSIREIERMTEQPERVAFVILTDGQENSSREYSQKQIFDLISWHRDEGKGWEFTFLGANQDSYAASASFGIKASSTMNYNQTNVGTQTAFATLARTTSGYSSGATATMDYSDEERKEVETTK